MDIRFTVPRPYTQNLADGFTIIEVLVASFLGSMTVLMVLSTILANRNLYETDLVRTRLNQNLRSSLDIIGSNIREAGENLSETLPAIEIQNGSGGAPDQLILRRNLLDEILNLCQNIAGGSYNTQIYFSVPGTTPGCIRADNLHNFTTWQNYRTSNGGTVHAFIWDPTNKIGEFFDYTAEADNGTDTLNIQRSGGAWQNSYTVGSAAIYMLEEWEFSLQNDLLQLIADDDAANPMNIVNAIIDFQAVANFQNGTSSNSLSITDDWTTLSSISLTITGRDRVGKHTLQRSISSQFFPRNILSN